MDLTKLNSNLNETLAILVLYRTELNKSVTFISLSDNLKKISMKMDLLVYDNSPNSAIVLQNYPNWNIHYVRDPTNPGVSKAYNYGFSLAKKMQKKWLLLLDQDTNFPENSLLKYDKAIADNNNIGLFAPVLMTDTGFIWSPCKYWAKKAFILPKITQYGLQDIKHKSMCNSGLLININVWEDLGGYKEELKLDFSDFYFLDRYRQKYSQFVLVDIQCLQGASTLENNLESSLHRFTYYCQGAKLYIENMLDRILLFLFVFFRTIKLTVRFKQGEFFWIFYQKFLR